MALDYTNLYATSRIFIHGIDPVVNMDLTPAEITLGESLLTPGLQTYIRVHNYTHTLPPKNYDTFKGKTIDIHIQRPALVADGFNDTMKIRQTIYRMSERQMLNPNDDQYILSACDQTLLEDARSLVSKSWKCTPPSTVVSDVLRSCAMADQMNIENADPARDYVAENIHPFQVVAQQTNVALADGNDPSFVHYMTFGNFSEARLSSGIHHFRSLKKLVEQNEVATFYYSEVPERYSSAKNILSHTFPCDFDLLSDILNGIDENGNDINSATLWNPLTNMFSLFGNQSLGCGIGGGNIRNAMTNNSSEQLQDACPDFAYLYAQKRQARIGLLDQDKIALRLSVPWNPELHAGQIIKVVFTNKADTSYQNYGTGRYLISALKHNIKRGGMATTMMDCVSSTVGSGIQ